MIYLNLPRLNSQSPQRKKPVSVVGKGFAVLKDVNSGDGRWEFKALKRKYFSKLVENTSHHARAERMKNCGQFMKFNKVLKDNGEIGTKLASARFCRDPFCPFCMEGRSNAYRRKLKKVIPKMLEKEDNVRFLMLTLTIKNCPITDLRKTVSKMSKAMARMRRQLSHIILGDVRFLEVTKGKDGDNTAHPHYHCLIAVPADYFDKKKDLYLTNEQWAELWGKCLKVDYVPSTNVKAITPKEGGLLEKAINEVAKYCTKSDDLLVDRDWTINYMDQMLYVKRISTSGMLRKYLNFLEQEPDDYIGDDEKEDRIIGTYLFRWSNYYNHYILIESEDYETGDIYTCGETVKF